MKHTGAKGFTLIEVMVVVIILMIVVTIGGCLAVVGIGGCVASKAISNGGVKGVATTLWEGTNQVSESESLPTE
jgi:Tfp pilus assembly protein PilE